ncbi:response regulator transcription factor [Roseivirga echinicomitans]|uniref:response regulator transcription factor n=1 Tax=Roseivirga echinicomitans TaxID=296218 RepID=UPI0009FCCC5E|nr:response regulator transcription factor [Roseivirga echinicomitans]
MSLAPLYICFPQYLIQQGLLALANNSGHYSDIKVFRHTAELKESIGSHNKETVILDYLNEDENFVHELNRWIQTHPNLNVLVITDDLDSNRIRSVLKMGVSGFLTKSCSEAEILEAISAIKNGKTFFCNRVLKALVDDGNEYFELSEREKEVVKLIAVGNSSSEIAETLIISIHTVNSHRKNILKKLKLKSPTELIIFAAEQGWVSLERK